MIFLKLFQRKHFIVCIYIILKIFYSFFCFISNCNLIFLTLSLSLIDKQQQMNFTYLIWTLMDKGLQPTSVKYYLSLFDLNWYFSLSASKENASSSLERKENIFFRNIKLSLNDDFENIKVCYRVLLIIILNRKLTNCQTK